ncbi:hypothetical protein BV898_08015 [Hypsibius exemplaris]|uniref:Uncharacterized protein n=1 Tax=Hypsibius exemplaris TaxID=2072580 RepID=A0A1W0WRR3_HYPEX|nr:hypothetical protein BV898_08015 [Hypsibius exemplaris]
MTQAQIEIVVNQMQTESIINGPITATITVYDDFQNWDGEDGASFCDNPIDLAVVAKAKDPKSPIYLFQGSCAQKVSIGSSGKITSVGTAAPFAKILSGTSKRSYHQHSHAE